MVMNLHFFAQALERTRAAAIHRQIDAADVSCCRAAQEGNRRANLLRLAQAPQGNGLRHAFEYFGRGLAGFGRLGLCDLIQTCRACRSGQYVVHGNSIGAEFIGQRLCPIGDRAADRIGDPKTVKRLLDRCRNHVDNASATGCLHARQHCLDQPLVAHEVLGEGGEVSLGIRCMSRTARRAAGIVDEDVNRALLHHLFCGLTHGIRLGKISHGNAMTSARELVSCGLQPLWIPGHQGAPRTQIRELFGRCPTYSLRRPTDEGVFSFQIKTHERKVPPYLRHMLTGIQHLHGALRWVVLVLMLLSIVKAFSGMSSGRSFSSADYKRGLFTMISLHLQLVLGFALYFGKGWSTMLGNADAMANTIMRFFSLEHMATMLIAVVLGTLGHSLAKRADDDRTKFRRQAIWFTISLVLILSSIPWPFRAGFEAYGWL